MRFERADRLRACPKITWRFAEKLLKTVRNRADRKSKSSSYFWTSPKVARAASTVLIDVSKSILNFRLSANISNPSLSIPVIVTASTAVTLNTLLYIGENRRLKPAIFAAFFTFSVKLFEFADSNEVG